MLEHGLTEDEIFKKLSEFYDMDLHYESGRILGSMCTKPDPVAMKAYKMFIETNLGDPGLFKGTAIMEREVISILGELLHLSNPAGHIVTGGTEANIMAMCVAKYLYESRRDGIPEVILPRSAHFSFKKIVSMLSLKPVYVPLDDNYKMDVSKIEDLITENTMAIVAIAGTTELGMVDDIEEISRIASSHNIYLHVDAALGGFILPFLDKENSVQLNFDFKCQGVSSMTIDPHKMGLAPVPAGGIIFRHKEHLDLLSVKTPYLTKDKQTTIVGTRTGAATAATWTLLNHYGKEGYKKTVKNTINLTQYTYKKLQSMKNISVICKPELNLISFKTDCMDVDSLKQELLKLDWHVSVAEYPYAIRLVLMPHVKKEHIDKFLKDLDKILKRR
ncbi:tyrosine decarboxylase MfnA [Methanosphaera sp. ISO3-F5]|uniref:tyrosine decarboxylase MfnA n=1 Tax=Methanosphaera sp. ISO3-F5 TaxID=1452353 RepID=UPI002B25BC6E|nr:tyrosine decarboxylase MfnA [Methanosphaera sp. ISO3-F5]WQH65217.1 tyrosine decarboxylase MfnA [Methanosphaera sp. ISO3-F5]